MTNSKIYDLEERTFIFTQNVIRFVKMLPNSVANVEITKQVIRSSGSIGANYIEANESLGKKDFAMRIRVCRKEAKETVYWLKLLEINGSGMESKRQVLVQEATELMKIFGSIVEKTK